MQCEDNSKLRTPLPEVCQTTDIGCVPIVSGKPDCAPMPDELPIAFDPSTTTLWLFACKTHEWIAFSKFTMCQLEALNLDNIRDICDALNIGVNYAGSGECKQGTITLRELAERILECLTLETKIITIGEGEGNKVKISIEGLPLDPVYVTGRNIWSEGGSGTEADPLRIATYDPICKWEIKSEADVDAANTKHLGACLDGKMSRVPFPPKVCELPSRNQAQVDASISVELIACLDGEGSKIPYPAMPCSYPQITPEEMMAASDKDFIVCVNGQNLKVPVPYNLYEASPCASPLYTIPDTQAAGGRITILACDGGQTIRIPIEGSGFFSYNTDWKYLCVPQTTGVPGGAPAEGTGPLRIDCDNTLWVWDCENNGWRRTKDGLFGVQNIENVYIPNICENLRFKGWFANNGDDCLQTVQMTTNQLIEVIDDCQKAKRCKNPVVIRSFNNFPRRGDRHVGLRKCVLSHTSDDSSGFKTAVYRASNQSWTPSQSWETDTDKVFKVDHREGRGECIIPIDNTDGDCRLWYEINISCNLVVNTKTRNQDYAISVVAGLSEEGYVGWGAFTTDSYAPNRRMASASWSSNQLLCQNWWTDDGGSRVYRARVDGVSLQSTSGVLLPGEKKDYYLNMFLIVSSKSNELEDEELLAGFASYADLRLYRGLRF